MPQSIRAQFVEFLTSLAISHVCHVELVFKTIAENFIPEISKGSIFNNTKSYRILDSNFAHGALSLDYDSQEELYKFAHSCLNAILTCLPL